MTTKIDKKKMVQETMSGLANSLEFLKSMNNKEELTNLNEKETAIINDMLDKCEELAKDILKKTAR